MEAPNYHVSKRWGCVLRTDNRPAGYGRPITPTNIILTAAERGAQPCRPPEARA